MTRNWSTAFPRRRQSCARGPSQPPGSDILGYTSTPTSNPAACASAARASTKPRRRLAGRLSRPPSPRPPRRSRSLRPSRRRRARGRRHAAARRGWPRRCRVEALRGLVVVGQRDEDAAAGVPGAVGEPGHEPGRGDAAVRPRLQPVAAHFVERAGLDGALEARRSRRTTRRRSGRGPVATARSRGRWPPGRRCPAPRGRRAR